MNRYLLLILLSSWAHVVPLSLQCETGVAYPNHLLSVPRSLMNNADVAVLKTYLAETLDKCITDCCAEKYGACTIASFKKNATDSNCQHFNCRPVKKCRFLSSSSTDSFSFTSSSSPDTLVPSSNASRDKSSSSTTTTVSTITTTNKSRLDKVPLTEQQRGGVTKESIATYSEEQLVFKDDNVTVKPRKGVDDVTEEPIENVSKSGVKPRKGVELDGVTSSDNPKSRVKPRKGVGPYQSHSLSRVTALTTLHDIPSSTEHSSESSATNTYKDIAADDLASALKKVFEDDPKVKDIKPSSTYSVESTVSTVHTTSTSARYFTPTTVATVHSASSVDQTTSSVLQSSLSTSYVASSPVQTPDMTTATTSFRSGEVVTHTPIPSSSNPTIFDHSKLLFHEIQVTKPKVSSEAVDDSMESESERKYKSSMHLVLSLVFGLLVLFSVLGVVAKRVYDGWMRRHYRRMDFLIDGMYNGYG